MIASMTGFAAATREIAGGQLAVELKSVNHRYLEFQCRLAEELRALEPVLREAVAGGLTRGKVDCRLTFTPAARRRAGPRPGRARPRGARRGLGARGRRVPAGAPALGVGGAALARRARRRGGRRPTRSARTSRSSPPRPWRSSTQTRRREGEKLAQVLRERLESMAALVARAQPLMPEVMKAFRDKLAARLAEAAAAPSDERIQQEVVLYAARIDVDEELERLVAHVAEFRRVLDKGGRVRQAPGLPVPGAQPRGQHARLEVGLLGHDAHLGGAEGPHRADARAGPEHRVGHLMHVRRPLRRGGALRRRQDQPRERDAGGRARHPAVGVLHHARAARGRGRGARLPLRRAARPSRR